MKKPLLLFSLLMLALWVQAQDVILKTSGEEIKAKVLEITLSEIRYKPADSLETADRTIPKSEVFMVKYANGEKELMQAEPANATPASPQEMYELGKREAKLFYKGNGAFWGSAASSFYFLVPVPVVIAAVPPKIKHSEVSDVVLLADQNYVRGYKKQAHKRKIGKAAAGMAVGMATMIIGTYIYFSANGLN